MKVKVSSINNIAFGEPCYKDIPWNLDAWGLRWANEHPEVVEEMRKLNISNAKIADLVLNMTGSTIAAFGVANKLKGETK